MRDESTFGRAGRNPSEVVKGEIELAAPRVAGPHATELTHTDDRGETALFAREFVAAEAKMNPITKLANQNLAVLVDLSFIDPGGAYADKILGQLILNH